MKITFDNSITKNLDEAIRREWLETNGLGGWASSTIAVAHTRRYHGLLVAATQPPVGRLVLLSKLDDSVEVDGQRFDLATNLYPGAAHPKGFQYLQEFSKDPFPTFTYAVSGIVVRRTVAAVHGENTTLVLYEVIESPSELSLELRPFVAGRDYHSLTRANDSISKTFSFQDGIFRVLPYDGLPELFIQVPGATFEAGPDWYLNFEYPVEQYRGLDYQEDLFTYGIFKCSLKAGDTLGVIISTDNPVGREAAALYDQEKQRRLALLSDQQGTDKITKILTLAADQFVVQRGEGLRTIIAGYNWFTDWGRDTMIALPGITLATGRFDDAKRIIQAFAESTSQGMLPNRFPDGGEEPEYNTVDATLWFFIAVYKYLQYSGDDQFVRNEPMPILEDIIAWHDRGTRYNIHTAEDGLLYAGESGVQLTWMDAKIGDWVVTPRTGKAVEINALWYNGLKILAELSQRFGRADQAESYAQRADQVKDRFLEVFWYDEGGYLYDYVDGENRNTTIRPNQIFALSLPFPLLNAEKATKVLEIIRNKLYTPFGLRSLAPDDPEYRPLYGGSPYDRDSAYHQGTVWGWLLGPFLTALVRIKGAAGKKEARKLLNEMKPHLEDGGIGTVSEIFDGDPPHEPHGCIAQAWSVAEILRAYVEDLSGP